MMRYLLFSFALSVSLVSGYAQVTIGSGQNPEKGALLQLKDDEPDAENVTSKTGGLLLPRVKLESKITLQPFISDDANFQNNVGNVKDKHTGLMVYNIETNNGFEQGTYVWDGTQWLKSGAAASNTEPKFFYMPSFNLPISTIGPNTYGIYEEYETQFTKAGLHVYQPTEIEFKVTYYDSSLIDNIEFPEDAENRFMVYDVLSTTAPEGAYLNIIIVVK